MVDYRIRLESKLKSLESKIKPLEEERKRLMGALRVLQELDSEDIQDEIPKDNNSLKTASVGTLIDAVTRIVELSGRMMTTKEVDDRVARERKVAKGSVYIALTRLKKRSVVFQDGRRWGLTGRDGLPPASGFEDISSAT